MLAAQPIHYAFSRQSEDLGRNDHHRGCWLSALWSSTTLSGIHKCGRAISPCPWGTERFREVTTASQGVEPGYEPEQRLWQVFTFNENAAEGTFIERVMLIVCEPRPPLLDKLKKASEFRVYYASDKDASRHAAHE